MKTLSALTLLSVLSGGAFAAPGFHNDVAPILREYCAGCHNNDDLDGEFSVETFRLMMKGGESGKAIVAGKASDSLLIKVLTGGKPKMPPKREPQPPAEVIATLQAWINAGAKGPKSDSSILKNLIVPEIAAAKGRRPITSAEYSPDGTLVALARYQSVELRDAKSRKFLRRFTDHPGKVNAVHFSANGERLVTASGIAGHSGVATIWDIKTGKKIREYGTEHTDVLYDAELSPDGKVLVTAGYDRFIRTWQVKDGEPIRSIEGHNGAIFDLAFSPDGEILASASADETVKLWRLANGQRLDTLNQPEGEQFAVAFTRDGRFVVAGGADKQIRVWRLVSRVKPKINPLFLARFAHEDDVTALEVSRDGTTLVSASADNTIKTWRLPRLDPGQIIGGQRDLVTALTLGKDNRTLQVGRIDGTRSHLRIKRVQTAKTGHRVETEAVAAADAKIVEVKESEPNNTAKSANLVKSPATISGLIMGRGGDSDLFKFAAKQGEEWVLEVNAARSKSPLDSRVDVLDAKGNPIERVRLQAVRDTWLTFRGKDSKTAQDFRVFKWREMSLNQFLYVNGEVVKLWHYPRGPDSGYIVYPGFGNRQTYFDTTPMAHPLGQNAYIVEPLAKGAEPLPNGLPVFTINYENDDESRRTMGNDSKLTFTAPHDGEFIARVADIRGFEGKEFKYTLTIRPRKPDFKVSVSAIGGGIPKGSGREFIATATRLDDYDGPITVEIEDVPEGFKITSPLVIEAGQYRAFGTIHAATNAPTPNSDQLKVATFAHIRGKLITHAANNLKGIKPMPLPKLIATVLPVKGDLPKDVSFAKPLELTINPGQTISARLKIDRRDFKARVGAGKHGHSQGPDDP
ncbi:MAG: c-type cytochrome domain-containing protein [Limisphaerales bacterium]